jgi:Fe(3+) dicitrate transport protein
MIRGVARVSVDCTDVSRLFARLALWLALGAAPAAAQAGPLDAGPLETGPGAADADADAGAPDEPEISAAIGGEPEPAPSAAVPAPVDPAVPPGAAAANTHEIVVVGAPLRRTPGSAQVLDERALSRYEQDDPNLVMTSVPGVYARGEDGFGLRPNLGLRGANPDRSKKVTLLEDGVLFGPAPYSAPAAYYFPIITRMQQVKVIKGPAAISYGPQTVGGAIDLITRPIPIGPAAGFDLAGGSYGYGKLHAYGGASDDRFGFLIEGVHLRSDGFKELPNHADTGFVRNEWMVKGSYRPDWSGAPPQEFQLKLAYSDEISNETYLGLTDADFHADPLRRYAATQLDRMQNHRTSFVLRHELSISAHAQLTTTIYRNDFYRVWRKVNRFGGAALFDVLSQPGSAANAVYNALLEGQGESSTPGETLYVGPNERDFVSQGIESRLRVKAETGALQHRIEASARLHYDSIDRHHSENGYLIEREQLVPVDSAPIVTVFNHARTLAGALQALDAISLGDLTITPGLRVELMDLYFEDRAARSDQRRFEYALLPGLGAYYALTRDLGVLGGVYRGFSPPAPEGKSSPEYSVNYELGARYASGPARAELIGFFNDYSNLTDVCTLSSGCTDQDLDRQFDAGRAHIYGVEALLQHDLRAGSFVIPFALAYTWTHSEFRSSFDSSDPIFGSVKRGDELPYVPRHQLRASLGVEHARASLNVSASYVSRMREQAGSEALDRALATDAQFLLDAALSVRIWNTLSVYAQLRNALDAHYIVARRPFGARPNAPRMLQVGARMTF